MQLNSAITTIKGIGEKTADSFAKMGVYTVGDILLRFPRTYVQYPIMEAVDYISTLPEGMHAILARVKKAPVVRSGRRMQVTVLDISGRGTDASMPGVQVQLIWYRMPYIKNSLKPGHEYVFYGKVITKNGRYLMEQPVIYEVEQYQTMEERFLPVYSLTAGITNNLMIKTIRAALTEDTLLAEPLPSEVRQAYQLCEYNYAIKQIHFPDSMDTLITARKRLVFDEFFLFIMGMQYQREKKQREPNAFSYQDPQFVQGLIEKLPYELTGAQKKALAEVQENMAGAYVMQRLIQGDVGSGKTIVAFLAMAWTAHNGYQSAIMAPTEVLARQHYESYVKLCEEFGLDYPVVLLTGSMTAKEKRIAYERLAEEPNAMVIGTHALIQEKAWYSNLALVITDEQHRFGVRQRGVFAEKGTHPHILVMSATPIPRTLAIIIYGDMDISVIDEVPARRLPIKNCVVNTGYRPKAYSFITEQVRLGHQAYVICPLVEESESMEGENVTDYAKRIAAELPEDIRVGVLHGKMKNDKKNQVMEQFAANEIQVLVSTTVVEVGVNVPNATVMMIENADRFGLAQLHQLRGRVGRGDAQSYCIMINTSSTKTAQKRLEILNQSNDGFFIASEDLKLRGPGDFFGIRQSGELAFQLADIYQDADMLKAASDAVREILEADPDLLQEEHLRLHDEMEKLAKEQFGRMNL
ncbi:MAG: ATP-dependent DNA helicase RecG [Lachnospiraceae bacterium]|nr:ATP-dependent DNA helicase RecG [Lachnospiraceae bacterium]MDY5521640.1 ATP-dependent DNA helicase RecG [Agathobacter sp.]